MTNYKGPNAFSDGKLTVPKKPTIIKPYQPSLQSFKSNAPAFDNKFPKSRYPRGGGQSGLRPVLEVAGGGGGGGYVAKAVHFDGSTWLATATSVAADSPLITFSLWVETATFPDGGVPWYLFDFDPPGRESGLNIQPDEPNGRFGYNWSISGADLNASSDGSVDGPWVNGMWNHLFGYVDTNHAAGQKIIALFMNGIDVTGPIGDSSDAFILNFGTKGWAVPDSTDDVPTPFFTGDYADCWIAPGVFETDITIFRDPITGKPKNPSGFPASAILFSGDKDTFPVNQGTGGTFTLTGALTNATTSPSD